MISSEQLTNLLIFGFEGHGIPEEAIRSKAEFLHRFLWSFEASETCGPQEIIINKDHLLDSIQPSDDEPEDEFTAQLMLENEELKRQCYDFAKELERVELATSYVDQQIYTDAKEFINRKGATHV